MPEDRLRDGFIPVTMMDGDRVIYIAIEGIAFLEPVYDMHEYAGTRVFNQNYHYLFTIKEKLYLHPSIEGQWTVKPDMKEEEK